MSDQLKAGEQEAVGGGIITFDPLLRKHAVHGADGMLHGYRGSLARARELAHNIPSAMWTPPAPLELSRSPLAMPLPSAPGVPPSIPKDQRVPGGDGKSPWRRRSGLPASESVPRVVLRKPKR